MADDKDYEQSALGKRVNELMDDGYDFGEAVKQAMSEGLKDGGAIGIEVLFSPKRKDYKVEDLQEEHPLEEIMVVIEILTKLMVVVFLVVMEEEIINLLSLLTLNPLLFLKTIKLNKI